MEAFVGGFREAPADDRFEVGRDLVLERRRHLAELGHDRLRRRLTLEDLVPCEHEIEDRSERIEVGSRVRRFPPTRLGGHVRRSPEDGADLRDPRRLARLAPFADARDPEVEELHEVLFLAHAGDKEVGRLDVAVDDPELVRFVQRATRLEREVNRAPCGERAVPFNQRREVDPVEELHRDEAVAVLSHPVFDHADRVRMPEEARRFRLARESPSLLSVLVAVRVSQDLHRHVAREELLAREPHVAHRAGPDASFEAILPELPGGEDVPARAPGHMAAGRADRDPR